MFSGELGALKRDALNTRSNAYAAGTYKNLRSQWLCYFRFCLYFGLQTIPAATNVLCLFAQFLSRSFKSSSAVRMYLSGVNTLHLFLDLPPPCTTDFVLRLTLKGVAKELKHTPLQKLPITPQMLLDIRRCLDFSLELHVTFWSCCLFAFFLCARKSNLLPISIKKINVVSHLLIEDVHRSVNGLVICIKWSKTNQTGEKISHYPAD